MTMPATKEFVMERKAFIMDKLNHPQQDKDEVLISEWSELALIALIEKLEVENHNLKLQIRKLAVPQIDHEYNTVRGQG